MNSSALLHAINGIKDEYLEEADEMLRIFEAEAIADYRDGQSLVVQ